MSLNKIEQITQGRFRWGGQNKYAAGHPKSKTRSSKSAPSVPKAPKIPKVKVKVPKAVKTSIGAMPAVKAAKAELGAAKRRAKTRTVSAPKASLGLPKPKTGRKAKSGVVSTATRVKLTGKGPRMVKRR